MEFESIDPSSTTTLPNPHHRKIELQSPLDLTYLQQNLALSARQKLDLHFPLLARQTAPPATVISLDGAAVENGTTNASLGTQEEEDPLRVRVRGLVDDFMARTWNNAVQNITVNGMDASTLSLVSGAPDHEDASIDQQTEREGIDFTYSAYDNRLQQKVASLYGELEGLTAQVSRLRREAPSKSAALYEQALKSELEKDDAEMLQLKNQVPIGKDFELTHTQRQNRQEDSKVMYERGLEELSKLAGLGRDNTRGNSHESSLTETVGKVQRARTVVMELE